MYDVVNKEISYEMNSRLIDIMCDYCDAFSFHLTNNFNICKSTELLNSPDGKKYLKYKASLLPFIHKFGNNILKSYKSLDYLGFHYYNKLEIFIVKLNKSTRDILVESKNILSWKFPNMPDDLCFFKNGVCVLRSVGHENFIFLYTKDKMLRKKFIDAGFVLQKTFNEKLPHITY